MGIDRDPVRHAERAEQIGRGQSKEFEASQAMDPMQLLFRAPLGLALGAQQKQGEFT